VAENIPLPIKAIAGTWPGAEVTEYERCIVVHYPPREPVKIEDEEVIDLRSPSEMNLDRIVAAFWRVSDWPRWLRRTSIVLAPIFWPIWAVIWWCGVMTLIAAALIGCCAIGLGWVAQEFGEDVRKFWSKP